MGTKILAIGSYRPNPTVLVTKPEENGGVAAQSELYARSGGGATTAVQSTCAVQEETTVSMAGEAILACLKKANVAVQKIHLIIHVSTILGHLLGEASRIQEFIGATNAATYQIKGRAYAGVVMAFLQAATLVKTGKYDYVVVSCVDHISSEPEKMSDSDDVTGDVATAVLFSRCGEKSGFVSFCHRSFPDGSSVFPVEYAVRYPQENKRWARIPKIKNEGILSIQEAILQHGHETMQKALDMARLSTADIQWFIPLNTGESVVKGWRDALGISPDRCLDTFARAGYCTLSSIPYTMMLAMDQCRFSGGDNILFHGADTGNRLVSAIWKW
jgi:3-oxoacyl-[acyl-carrier-protein] synthase III